MRRPVPTGAAATERLGNAWGRAGPARRSWAVGAAGALSRHPRQPGPFGGHRIVDWTGRIGRGGGGPVGVLFPKAPSAPK
ncbi:hypothetical protein ACTMTF_06325 [Nonomuraea sp. ZG12]|uniref:hypothetical protein n=1 Tax=Nonomuraea sp. ZG12 TaxID=3452207 RepID=UPI003F89A836